MRSDCAKVLHCICDVKNENWGTIFLSWWRICPMEFSLWRLHSLHSRCTRTMAVTTGTRGLVTSHLALVSVESRRIPITWSLISSLPAFWLLSGLIVMTVWSAALDQRISHAACYENSQASQLQEFNTFPLFILFAKGELLRFWMKNVVEKLSSTGSSYSRPTWSLSQHLSFV